MVLTILPVNTLAEGETTSAPDVSVYATKTQLMDDTFAPNAGGKENNIGKIVFGKNFEGKSQEWFVLGKDTGVDGDNTIIFTTTSILDNTKFSESTSNKDYSYKANTGYGDSDGTVEVYPSHYGASDIRKILNSISTNIDYFTSAEQGLMNSTTISTPDESDFKLEPGGDEPIYNIYYTNNDKLYLPYVTDSDNYIIRVSSNNQLQLYFEYYWKNENFWLRKGNSDYSLAYHTEYTHPYTSSVDAKLAVRPASNLNLTNVLFASAAETPSEADNGLRYSTIPSDKAMTLRLDGSNKDVINLYGSIGEVYYDNATNEIVANKGNTGYEVYLVVQGKDPNMTGNQNWYYSKKITGEETIKASEIKEALGLVSNVSLADSKIWLEINVDANGMTYAVQAKAVQEINSVKLSVPVPVAGNPIDSSVTCNTNGVGIYLTSWDTIKPEAGYYKQYTVTITLKCELGYKFASDVTGEINGNNVTVSNDTEDKKKVSYTFPYTKDKLISVTDPTITFENGTSLEVIKNSLPTHVKVTTEGRKK